MIANNYVVWKLMPCDNPCVVQTPTRSLSPLRNHFARKMRTDPAQPSTQDGPKQMAAADAKNSPPELPSVVKRSSKQSKCYFVHETNPHSYASLAFLENIPVFGVDADTEDSTSPDFSLNLTGLLRVTHMTYYC